ncbi:MAG: putative Ribosomal small subunit methyltransferase [Candidatus Saccharibacteria bacterium]|nr:putative Ribosomal small subunit methyltransferase [Candidatus Saccharibacteria bacterium]
MPDVKPKKNLGQHWLHDKKALNAVIDAAGVGAEDVILEIGPGLGTLTEILVDRAREVIAIELDESLAEKLHERVEAGNLEVIRQDILRFDLTSLPPGYKVVANIPYYLTANLLRVLAESPNAPAKVSLLVQKEVAQRVAAGPGQMSLLAVSVQLYYQPELHEVIPARLFTPPPKVDSQIISLTRRPQPLFPDMDSKLFFTIVRAGFSEKRKKLRSSLAGGLRISKPKADELLAKAGINGDLRAQELTLENWYSLQKTASAGGYPG